MSDDLKNYEELFYETNEINVEFTAHPTLKVNPNFSFEDENYSSKKAKELLEKARNETNETIKLNLLKECLIYNNTDEEAILEILKFQKDEKEKKLILKKYGYHLSGDNFKIYFNKEKKGVIELFKELFNLFEIFKIGFLSDIKRILAFVEEFCLIKLQNIFIDESNIKEELFFHFVFLVKKIANLILSIKLEVYEKKVSFEEKLKKYFSISEQQYINELIELAKAKLGGEINKLIDIKNDVMFINFKLFTHTFSSISNLLKSVKDEIYFCLDNLNNSNLYIFICIQELILNLLKGYSNSKNEEFIEKIKNHISNRNKDYNNHIKNYIKIYNNKSTYIKVEADKDNINNLIFKREIDFYFAEKIKETKVLNNAYIYDWEKIINNDSMYELDFNIPFEYQFLNFIKIEYINEFNFIKFTYGFIEELLLKISKSNTIITLLNEIYPGCETIFNEKSDFIGNLIKKVLSRCFYFCMFSDKVGCEYTEIKRIYFYLINTHTKYLDPKYELKKFLIVNLGLFIYIFHHEFFGHYLLHYLNILTTNKYNSPFSKVENKKESGRFIEIKLFNKKMNIFNLFQLLYILDIDNYGKDYKAFNSNFQNINKFDISENLFNMFKKHFGIELIFSENEKVEFFNLFDKNIGKGNDNLVIMNPSFNDCLPLYNIDDNIDFLYYLSLLEK